MITVKENRKLSREVLKDIHRGIPDEEAQCGYPSIRQYLIRVAIRIPCGKSFIPRVNGMPKFL